MVLTIAFVLGIVLILAAINNTNAWDRFKSEHHCAIVAKKDGQYVYTFGKSGGAWVPGTTTYRCDDGVDYTR